jgi:hypothetical protein
LNSNFVSKHKQIKTKHMANNSEGAPIASLVKLILAVVVIVIAGLAFNGTVGHNDNHNWQIVQSINGEIRTIDSGGYYWKGWGTVWTYPKYITLDYTEPSKESPGDDSVEVTFNDGGTAKMSTVTRIETPITDKQRLLFHQQLPDADGTHRNVRAAVKAYLVNCLKSSAPLMTSSENQTSRKAEYTQVVQEQLMSGLFEMRRVERVLKDQFDAKGQPITVFATEVILDEKSGKPKISEPSPLTELGIQVKQFSVTGTKYDEMTQKQFAVKKDAFLATENSKAQREKEVQQRLMVVEKGYREKAEIEAEANKIAATATIKATQDATVATTKANQEKVVAETEAAKLVAVATQTKIAAETAAAQEKAVAELKAAQQLEVARLNRQAAEENAKAQITMAEAQQKSLALAGAMSEHDRVIAELAVKRDIGVAAELSKISVPHVVIGSGASASAGNTAGGGSANADLINISLLKNLGLLDSKFQGK